MTAADYRALANRQEPRKFRNQPVMAGQTRFDSRGEARRWQELGQLQTLGLIKDLRRQVRYPLTIDGRPLRIRSEGYPNGRSVTVVVDYDYVDTATGRLVVEDFKGADTPVGRLKRALFEHIYGFPVLVTRHSRKKSRHPSKKTVK